MISPYDLIIKKRNGHSLAKREIEGLLRGFVRGTIPEYQISALLMAIYFRGMSPREITALTDVMMRSGKVIDPDRLGPQTADKHSTGGVGDKISLILAPAVAACGVRVPMMSGRGLGHTGGTLDKLESIPGFRTDLPIEDAIKILKKVDLVMVGQTGQLVPADRKLYALRDVTGTVDSIPLIASSIMSKKVAAGPRSLVLDVKVGRGAFMQEMDDARELASTMVSIGRALGRRVSAVISDMNQPLGHEVGNILEVRESIQVLRGEGPKDLIDLTRLLGGMMLQMAGAVRTVKAGEKRIALVLSNGRGLDKFREMTEAQGGDARFVDHPELLPDARYQTNLEAPTDGIVTGIDALKIGLISVALGAGRRTLTSTIDPTVGLTLAVKVGDQVSRGDLLTTVHHSQRLAPDLRQRTLKSFTISPEPVEPLRLVYETVDSE